MNNIRKARWKIELNTHHPRYPSFCPQQQRFDAERLHDEAEQRHGDEDVATTARDPLEFAGEAAELPRRRGSAGLFSFFFSSFFRKFNYTQLSSHSSASLIHFCGISHALIIIIHVDTTFIVIHTLFHPIPPPRSLFSRVLSSFELLFFYSALIVHFLTRFCDNIFYLALFICLFICLFVF